MAGRMQHLQQNVGDTFCVTEPKLEFELRSKTYSTMLRPAGDVARAGGLLASVIIVQKDPRREAQLSESSVAKFFHKL